MHAASEKGARVEVPDPATGKILSSWSGDKTYTFPVGQVQLKIRGETRTVTIEESTLSEFSSS